MDKSQNALLCDFVMYARTLLKEKWTDSTEDPEGASFLQHGNRLRRSTDEAVGKIPIRSL